MSSPMWHRSASTVGSLDVDEVLGTHKCRLGHAWLVSAQSAGLSSRIAGSADDGLAWVRNGVPGGEALLVPVLAAPGRNIWVVSRRCGRMARFIRSLPGVPGWILSRPS